MSKTLDMEHVGNRYLMDTLYSTAPDLASPHFVVKKELEDRGYDTEWLLYCLELRAKGRVPSPAKYRCEQKVKAQRERRAS